MDRPHLALAQRPDARLELTGDRVELGRGELSGIGAEAATVSRRHFAVSTRGHGHVIEDLGSTNGTHLNGQPLIEPTPLRDGDEIVVGGAVALVFRDPMATPMAPSIGRLEGVWIDPETDTVWVDAARIEPPLSERQVVLLRLLLEHEGDYVPNHIVVDTVWSDVAADGVSAEAVDALVKRVRQRLRDSGRGRDLLERRRGAGIRLSK